MGLRIVSCGEILWDIFPTGPVLGGAPLNFAFRVNNLGHQGLVASAVGEDAQGDALLEAMARLGLDAGLVQRDPGHPTGRVDIRFDLAKNPSYTIVPGVAYEFLQYEERLAAAVAAADCFCFSTLAQREPVFSATLQRLLAAAAGGQILYDINLRKGCYTPEMIRTSLAAATILKLNEEEAEEVGRLLYRRTLLVRDVAERLILGGGLRTCVVTLGQKGSYAVDADGRSAYSPGFAVDLVDPCGAGDSFAAGFMCALLSGGALGEACELGNALGALTSAQNGATTPITIASVEALRRRPGARVADPEYPLLSV